LIEEKRRNLNEDTLPSRIISKREGEKESNQSVGSPCDKARPVWRVGTQVVLTCILINLKIVVNVP